MWNNGLARLMKPGLILKWPHYLLLFQRQPHTKNEYFIFSVVVGTVLAEGGTVKSVWARYQVDWHFLITLHSPLYLVNDFLC